VLTHEALAGFEDLTFHDQESVCKALAWLLGKVKGQDAERLDYPIRLAKERTGTVLREEPLIHVGTCHSFKGSEADTVFVYPDLSTAGAIEWQSNRDSILRLFYVAITRAREELVLCDPAAGLNVLQALVA
jgi:superfamily I DNA/RNA helicase